jgi:hypothetical protein
VELPQWSYHSGATGNKAIEIEQKYGTKVPKLESEMGQK